MTKRLIWILMILLIVFTAGFANENYYWYQKSDDENSVAVEVYDDGNGGGGGAGGNPWTPGGSWNPGGNWVLFAVSGNIEIDRVKNIKGKGGYFGSNCSPENKNDLSSFAWSGSIKPVENYYIGHEQNSTEVIDIFSNPSIQSDFYDYWENDKFGKLGQRVTFTDPSENFPLKDAHFSPGIELEYKDHPEDDNNGQGQGHGHGHGQGNNDTPSITINKSMHYGEINTNNYSDQKVILEVGSDDLVVQIDNLIVGGKTKFEIQPSESIGNSGRVFLFVEDCNELNNTVIGNPSFQDKTFFFYSGANEFKTSGIAKIYGTVYVLKAGVELDGSGYVHNLLSIADQSKDIDYKLSNGDSLNSIYAKDSSISLDIDGKIISGIVTGGRNVKVDNNDIGFKYIYAPNAEISFLNSGTYIGSFIGNSIYINRGGLNIQGPPIDEIKKPVIPRPNPPSGSGGDGEGDWLITLNLNPDGVSTGELAVTSQDGFDAFDDGGYQATDNFNICFGNTPSGHFRVTALWGFSSWTWTIDDLKDAGLYLGAGQGQGNPQLKALHIIPGDYTGNITVYNDSTEKTRVKVDGITGKFSNNNNGAPINPGQGEDTIEID